MRPYTQMATGIADLIATGGLKPGKSITLKALATHIGEKPGFCAESLKPMPLRMIMQDELKEAGAADVVLHEVGSGRYRRFIFKRNSSE